MLKLIGIFNILFFYITIYYLISLIPDFTFKKYTASDLTNFKETKSLFKITFFIFSINQIIFSIMISSALSIYVNPIVTPLFIIGGTFACLVSIFSVNKHEKIHNYSAITCGSVVWIGVIFLIFGLMKITFFIGIILLIITSFIPILFLKRNKLKGGQFEIPIFTIIAIWNIVFSFYLF
jgi:hypothetical membrane protein